MKVVFLLLILLQLSVAQAGTDYKKICDNQKSNIGSIIDHDLQDLYVRPQVTNALVEAFINAGIPISASDVVQPFAAPKPSGMDFYFGVSVNGKDRHFIASVQYFLFNNSDVSHVEGQDDGVINPIGQVVHIPTKVICSGSRTYSNVITIINSDTNNYLNNAYLNGDPNFGPIDIVGTIEVNL